MNIYHTIKFILLSFSSYLITASELFDEARHNQDPVIQLMQLKEVVERDETLLDDVIEFLKEEAVDPLIAYAYFQTPESAQRLTQGITACSDAELRLLLKDALYSEYCCSNLGHGIIKELFNTMKRTQKVDGMRGLFKLLRPSQSKNCRLEPAIQIGNGSIVFFQHKKNNLNIRRGYGMGSFNPFSIFDTDRRILSTRVVDQMMLSIDSTNRIGLHHLEYQTDPADTRPGRSSLVVTHWEKDESSLQAAIDHIE